MRNVWLMAYMDEIGRSCAVYNLETHYSHKGAEEVIREAGYTTDWAEWTEKGEFKKLIFEKLYEG